jgi:hydrogenase large subunit
MGALFGGLMPHPLTYVACGFTATPRPERISRFRELLGELDTFVDDVWLPDVDVLAAAYDDYYAVGAGPRALLAFGGFDLDAAGSGKLFPRGRIEPGLPTVEPLDLTAISESVERSWYDDAAEPRHPSSGVTAPAYPKDGAYSWLKAARYDGRAYETGPLARMAVAGLYDHGISVLDRHQARALEARELVTAMSGWLDALVPTAPVYEAYEIPATGEGFGLCEASRGALGHWLSLESGLLTRYQVMTPTCWNASPRDGSALPGPLEQALIGTPVANAAEPVEALRVVHSFDPCLACAVHVVRPKAGRAVERVVSRVVAAPWGPG